LTLGIGLTIGLSLSVLFKALNSGSDLSTYSWFQVIGWILAVTAGVLLFVFLEHRNPPLSESLPDDARSGAGHGQPGFWRTSGLALGVISVLSLLYFSFTSPNVIAR
jgi:hypothetical protein